MNKTDKRKSTADHPRVKIYYLRNDPITKNQIQHYSSPVAGPSISCLSSFIQKEKNQRAIETHQKYWENLVDVNNQEEEIQISHMPNISFTQQAKPALIDTQNLPAASINHRTAYTTDLKPSTNQIRSNTFHIGSPHQKRFIQTSQQKYNHNHQNNQALSKDFLCNIVKQWNTFTERQKSFFKKSVLNKRKKSIDCQKIYRPDEIEELKKNKSLMKQHFNLFLDNQKTKSTKKKEKSLTLLKAIFHRQDSQSSMTHKNMQALQSDFKSFKVSKTQISTRARNSSKPYESQRRFSVNEKNPKSKYFRLLYGPQVKLIPRMFEQNSKIKNFDWTKLDKKLYEPRKKTKNSIQLQQI